MKQEKINRINQLAQKAKIQPLTAPEKAEQQSLRQEYLAAVRSNLRSSLDLIKIAPYDCEGGDNCTCGHHHHK
ncbi:MAG: DUF896 domain-containing protein [Syntrophomonadaceae bacterium]|jgi:uncharacterized protein YnzC (UPF0291/DUF896 family)|nr:DUF896 domain-containing protein [Syntrophomonadaceae bacterium]